MDVANYYSFSHHGFGVFDTEGVEHRVYYALLPFSRLSECPHRVATSAMVSSELTALAGLNPEKTELRVLTSNLGCREESISLQAQNLPWRGRSRYEVAVVDDSEDLKVIATGDFGGVLELWNLLPAPAVGLIRVWEVADGDGAD